MGEHALSSLLCFSNRGRHEYMSQRAVLACHVHDSCFVFDQDKCMHLLSFLLWQPIALPGNHLSYRFAISVGESMYKKTLFARVEVGVEAFIFLGRGV